MKESLTSYIRLQTLIKEALTNPTKKKDCGCGGHLTENYSLLREEEFSSDELKDILSIGIKGDEVDDEILDKALKGELKDIKESLGIASILVAPILAKLAGKLLNKIQAKLGSKNRSGDELIKFGKGLHKLYTLPVRLILQAVGGLAKTPNKFQDKAFRVKVANVIYAAVMIFVAGKGVVKGIQHFAGINSALTVIFETIEGGGSITEVVAAAMEAVGAGVESLDAVDTK